MRASEARSLIASVVARLAAGDVTSHSSRWVVGPVRITSTRIAVAPVFHRAQNVRAFVKLALNHEANRNLYRHHSKIVALHSNPELEAWCKFVPAALDAGDVDGHYFTVETLLAGQPARRVKSQAPHSMLSAAATTISQLHGRTALVARVDDELLEGWVRAPISRLRTTKCDGRALDRLEARLVEHLANRTMTVSIIHGDYWLGNVLADPESRAVTGVVDWEWSAMRDLPSHDLLHLALYGRCVAERRSLGALVRDRLSRRRWSGEELLVLEGNVPLDGADLENLLLLYWIRHIASNLAQSSRYADRWMWTVRNIRPPLRM
jgi:hypothetical protein